MIIEVTFRTISAKKGYKRLRLYEALATWKEAIEMDEKIRELEWNC
ncbi:hypothetical protein [Candidatus Enterococcus dunnyi]|uniref:Uncharacterized protein n=1 Tax=Candidatus Enterococcus dunnyi TaxID=1834192 RepID=A0A200J0I7_9ENTE|nr:hypothetical protein [Enterococcus sp. 9D6_DIV0238]OUZ30359.1 hypothetical protein A5889_002647 [Enterococcus sp. 9D6_DIV0238]